MRKVQKFMKKPRIAVIGVKGLPSRIGGLEVYIDDICTRMVDDYDITVFCRKKYCDRIVKYYKGVHVVHIPSIYTKHLDAISYGVFATVFALIKGYDLFWYHAMGSATTEWLPKLFKKRVLSTVHGLDWKRERFGKLSSKMVKMGEMSIARCSTGIITLNKGDADYFMKKWNRKCFLINNGVAIPDVHIDCYDLEYEKDSYFLFASRITPEKDLKTLIKAFMKCKTNKKLIVAGKGYHAGGYEDEAKKMAESNPNIVFLGHVSYERLCKLYVGAYAYVLPSTIEGQSIGLLEAMSFGVPCIVSDIPENLAVISDVGYSFKVGDEKSLIDQINYSDTHYKEIKENGLKARERVIESYDINITANTTKKVIRKVMGI